MRNFLSLLLLTVLCVVPTTGWSGGTKELTEVGVSTLMKSPEHYSQPIKVIGVVSQIAEEARIFGLIDLEEFKTCKKVTCASLVLPVRWTGTMPGVGQQVTVSGAIAKEGDFYLFIASDLTQGSVR